MTALEEFRQILKDKNVTVDEESVEFFRDFVDAQADMILDKWLSEREVVE
ncbi:MAG: hypothetical protein AAGA35_02130 [Patescibacteria group bacterium]